MQKRKLVYYYSLVTDECHSHAQFYLGSIFYEGLYVDFDIEKAIHHFKEASCFNNQYAKNNLAIIYKKGQGLKNTNIFQAKEYLKEAISQKNDPVAMFNLAHIYFFEKEENYNLNESIELLIKSSTQKIIYSIELLCLETIKKYKSTTISDIKNDFKKIDAKLFNSISKYIDLYNLNEPNFYNVMYNKLKSINLVYYGDKIENQKKKYKHTTFDKRIPINHFFYEGLGDILID
ncbi:hypothetical protein M9Y10_035416 [Tritrichomonas musculus]|uniref:Beta-lactamase n=1 Tax=Tritrichomonas musculus TaxID=1915356 RepID=A0ABR2KHK9_9EUKA